MLSPLLLLVVLTATAESFYVQPKYQSTYHSIEEHSYKYYTTPSNWYDALSQCVKDEAELYFPKSLDELASIQHEFNLGRDKTIFVSMVKNNKTGNLLYTLDGRPYDEVYNIWTDETADATYVDQDCVALQNITELRMSDCFDEFPFICKKNFNRNAPSICGSQGYQQTNNKCIKIHRSRRTWSEAFRICVEEGGRLILMDKPLSSDYYTRQYLQGKIQEDNMPPYYIGFREILNGITYNVDGTMRTDSPFNGEMDNTLCGVLLDSYQTGLMDCNEPRPFICEKL